MKITADQKKEIFMLCELGEFDRQEIAEKYGITRQRVNQIYFHEKKGNVMTAEEKELAEKTIESEEIMSATPTFLKNAVENDVEKCKSESVNHPAHYGGDTLYEAIKVIEAWELGFCLGNAVKYISRAGKKDKTKEIEDLKKAVWYINRHIEKLDV